MRVKAGGASGWVIAASLSAMLGDSGSLRAATSNSDNYGRLREQMQ